MIYSEAPTVLGKTDKEYEQWLVEGRNKADADKQGGVQSGETSK